MAIPDFVGTHDFAKLFKDSAACAQS